MELTEAKINTEEWREYQYKDGSTYRIEKPQTLWWKRDENGPSHRVLDDAGVTHCPERGWVAIRWFAPSEPVSF